MGDASSGSGKKRTLIGKVFLVGINCIISLAGLGVVGIGFFMMSRLSVDPESSTLGEKYQKEYSETMMVTALGGIMFVVGFSGCCGAIAASRWLLITYAVVMTLVSVLMFLCGCVLLATAAIQADEKFRNMDKDFFLEYKIRPISFYFDRIQIQYKCCGVSNASDYRQLSSFHEGINVPASCCYMGDEKQSRFYYNQILGEEQYCPVSDAHEIGCRRAATDREEVVILIVGGVLLTMTIIQLIGVILAIIIARTLRRQRTELAPHMTPMLDISANS